MISMLLSFSFLLSLLQGVHSQITPSPVQAFAFARAGPKLYIQGGDYYVNDVFISYSSQTFSLDLSTSWSVDAAPWKMLSSGMGVALFNGVATPDNQTFLAFINSANSTITIPKYNIASDTWDPNPLVLSPDSDIRQGIRPVIDPTTWLTYMNAYQNLDIFNPNSSTVAVHSMPPNMLVSKEFGGATYVSSRKSIMYFGGLNGTIQFDALSALVTEYNMATDTWSNFTTSGQPPVARADFCMTTSEDGNTILIYGGRIAPNMTQNPPANFTGTFYMLDLPSGQWTQLPDGGVRLYMACLVIGDQFVAWGGSDGLNTIRGPPVIFSLTTRQWITSYTAPAYYLNASKPTSTTSTTSTSLGTGSPSQTAAPNASTKNLAAILGGVFGGLLVLALSGIIYLYLRRREDKIRYGAPPEQQGGNVETLDEPATSQSNDSHSRNPQTPASSLREPQDFSGIAPGSIIFSSPMGPDMQYTVSSKEPVLSSMASPVYAAPQAEGPVVYIPNIPHAPVPSIQYTPTKNSADIYQAYNFRPNIATQDMSLYGNPVTTGYNIPGYTSYVPAGSDTQFFTHGNNGSYNAPVAMIAPSGQAYAVATPTAYSLPPPVSVDNSIRNVQAGDIAFNQTSNNNNSNVDGSTNYSAPTTPSLTTSNIGGGTASQGSLSPPSIPQRPVQSNGVRYTALTPGSTENVSTTAARSR